MKSLRRKCAALALLSAGLVAPAQAQVNPYGITAAYPSTNQSAAQYYAAPNYTRPVSTNSGPTLMSASMPNVANTASVLGNPPASPITPVPNYGAAPGGTVPLEAVPPPGASGGYGAGSAVESYGSGGYGQGSYGQGLYSQGLYDQGTYGAGGAGSYGSGDASCVGDGLGGGGGLGYGYPPPGGLGLRSGWFGSITGLIMTRDQPNHYFFSYERTNEANQLTDAKNAHMGWGGGFDLRFGQYFNCGMNAWEAVYWGLFPSEDSTITTTDGITQLDAILDFSQLDYNGGAANLLTDDAQIHVASRENEFHNIELNLLQLFGGNYGGTFGPGVNYRWLAGARYFKFHDRLSFAADTVDRQLTGDPNEVYYDIELDNNLIGFQVGAEGEFCAAPGLTLDFGTKVGLFGNRIQHLSQIGGAAGIATINNGPNLGRSFLVDNSKTDVAFMAEANLGVEYCLNDCWTLTSGYRAVAVTGVALPTNQIYPDLRGIQDVELISSNGSLLLHGAYFGAEYCY